MSVPIAISRLVPLTRYSCCNGGASVPAALAAASRSSLDVLGVLLACLAAAARRSRVSAAGWSNGSASTSAGTPRPRNAAAIARSSPTRSDVLTRSSATSRARCESVAEPIARSKSTIAGPEPVDHDVLRVQGAVGDARLVEPLHLAPEVVEQRVGDGSADRVSTQARPVERPDHQQRGTGTGNARDDDRRHAHVGPLREQRHVRLVLDLAQAGEVHARAAVLVEDGAADLRQELRVGLVPAEHPDRQRSVARVGSA